MMTIIRVLRNKFHHWWPKKKYSRPYANDHTKSFQEIMKGLNYA